MATPDMTNPAVREQVERAVKAYLADLEGREITPTLVDEIVARLTRAPKTRNRHGT